MVQLATTNSGFTRTKKRQWSRAELCLFFEACNEAWLHFAQLAKPSCMTLGLENKSSASHRFALFF